MRTFTLFAFDQAKIDDGRLWLRAGVCAFGIGVVGCGVAVFLSKAKPDKPRSPAEQFAFKMIGVVLIVIGICIPAYGWFVGNLLP